ncbi:MAG: hypothetical protein IJV63_00110 [Bacteroidales bacterium]|nr:hypothetical protein [Bacteroidales bacterium]MBQ9195127.1 hypothetical protein [Bacteroidales bacterium]MBQ9701386.1 hypothetical protein [Bacteroidales bacterium]
MRKFLPLILALCLLSGCSKDNIWCQLVLVPQMPEGEEIASLTIDPSLQGNFLRNVNTLETYNYPALVAGRMRVTVLKGFYALSFDGVAELTNGRERKVRFTAYSTEANSVSLVEDECTLTLPLIVLK